MTYGSFGFYKAVALPLSYRGEASSRVGIRLR